jgi:hypothetical protein
MRRIFYLFLLILAVPILISATTITANGGITIKDNEDGQKIALTIPGFIVRMGGWFIPKEEEPELRIIIRKMGTVSVNVTEGSYYRSDISAGDFQKKKLKIEKDGYSPLVIMQSEDEKVMVAIKQDRKSRVRKLAVLVDENQETFVYVRLNCKISLAELSKLIESGAIEGLDASTLMLNDDIL